NISLINRRRYLPQLLLTLSLKQENKNHPTDSQALTGHSISISLTIAMANSQERQQNPTLKIRARQSPHRK
ncbi:MAG: hypothetical protein WA476_20820, partial [Acidobacteriaceae bacterium]